MAGPIRIAILAQALAAQRGIKKTTGDLKELGKSADKADKPTSRVSDTVTKLTKSAAGAATAGGTAIAPSAAVAAAAVSAAPAGAAAAGALINVARAAGGAAPALAAIAAAGLFVKLTLTQIAPAIVKSLTPVTQAFQRAGAAAGALASKGVAPLAAQFAKVGIPIVAQEMNRIAVATNKTVKGFLAWANSASGLTALRRITDATASAFGEVAPHVLALATALGEMIGRIAGVSLAAGSSGLNRVLDLMTAKLKTISGASVQKGLDGLRAAFITVRDTVVKVSAVVRTAIEVYRKYQTQIMLISDVLGVLAIAFGAPIFAIIAAVGLIVRHFAFVTQAIDKVRSSFKTPGNTAFLDNIRTAVATVWPAVVSAFNQIKAAVMPTLIEITRKVRTELVPALGEFIAAAAPVVAFFIEKFAPIIATAFRTVGAIISGAITIISGIFQVFTGLLRGDWSTLWAGIKTIVRGAATAVKGIISGAFSVIRGYFSALKGVITGLWSGAWRLVGSIAATAVRNASTLIAGLVASVRTKFQQVRDAISSKLDAALGVVRRVVGRIKSAFSIDLSAAGSKIIGTLIAGIGSRAGDVVRKIQGIAQSIRDHFPFSPARRGPLKRKPMFKAGRNIIRDLAAGMSRQSKVEKIATGIAAQIARTNQAPGLFRQKVANNRHFAEFNLNIYGLVGDPVALGKQVETVLDRYQSVNGRRPGTSLL